MTVAKKLEVRMGLQSVKKPLYASEPGYVAAVQEQMKVLRDDLDYIFQQFEDVTPEITKDALEPTLEKSKVYCPKKTKALVDSAYLEIVTFRGNPKVEIGYAKGGVPRYATYVHEMVAYQHEAPTQAKFLERAVNEDLYSIIDRVAEGYRRFMGA